MRKSRDTGLDITRIVAFMSVPAVHFFLNSGFYDIPVKGNKMYIMVIFRTLFMICVPLFMLLSGYLMSGKKIMMDKKSILNQYKKLDKIIITYVLATIIIIFYRNFYLHEHLNLKNSISNILGYNQYSWYVEMYIGLFLLIPFLNCLWHSIQKDSRTMLVIVMILLTTLPSLLNIWNFESLETLRSPWLSTNYNSLVPDWWVTLYPITYYYIGAYIKEYINIKKMKTWKLIFLSITTVIIFGCFNIWRSNTIKFVWGVWCGWGSFQNVIDTILIFLMINSINYTKISHYISDFLALISDLTFGAYILTWIPDNYNYSKLIELETVIPERFKYFPIIVGKTIVISLSLALVVYFILNCGRNMLYKMNTVLKKRKPD